MINVLGFILECAAIGVVVGVAASLATAGLARTAARLSTSWSATRQADLAMALAVLPGTLAVGVVLAAAVPSLLGALGVVPDHCPSHGHHPHLCIVHLAGLRPAIAVTGASALAVLAYRAVIVAVMHVRAARDVAALVRLGTTASEHGVDVVRVPGAPRLCHAVGVLTSRVLVSSTLLDRLSRVSARAAVLHEAAHVRRRDPLALLLLDVAGLFSLPFVARSLSTSFRQAAEEACDAGAAAALGDRGAMAATLVDVARLRLSAPPATVGAVALTGGSLERRVRRLLDGASIEPPRAVGVPGVVAMGASVLMTALAFRDPLHHLIETVLAHLA